MKRMLWAFALALMVHVMAFRLDIPWARPALELNSRDSVAISLVCRPPAKPAPEELILPIPIPDPKVVESLARLAKKQPPKPKPVAATTPKAAPRTIHDAPFAPLPQPAEKNLPEVAEDPNLDADRRENAATPPQAPDALPRQTGDPLTDAPSADETAAVQVSIPLRDVNPRISYPRLAIRRGYSGVVVLKVLIGRDGRPLRIEIERSSGYGVLDSDAVEEVRAWRFRPARRGGVPVQMWVQQPVAYRLE